MTKKIPGKPPNIRHCRKGHAYYKSSACPVCPVCEAAANPTRGFLAVLAAPAQRALMEAGILTLKKLSSYSKQELLHLHGLGPSSLPKLEKALTESGLKWKDS